MVEEVGSGAGPSLLRRWRARLLDRLTLLIAIAIVFLVVAGLSLLPAWQAGVIFVVIALVAVVVPGAAEIANPMSALPNAGETLRETAVRRVTDALPDPCLILDKRSNIIHRNPPAVQQFPGLLEGNPIAFSLRSPAMLSAVDAVRRTGAAQSVELHQTVPNETWHRVSVAELDGEDGLLVITLQSLTDQRRLDAMRTDFIANVSHELRTPLTSLVGFIDTLLGPAAKDAAAREKFLGIMRNQAARMSKLIDDLLSLSRIEMRQHLRPTARVDIAALLREVREGLQNQATEAGVTVNLALPDGEVPATGDRDELYEVFENLIENAVKYGGDGGKVDVALIPVTDRPAFGHQVSITD
jgi:two-component system phosphate regulon sensor histidine kinase PhoR